MTKKFIDRIKEELPSIKKKRRRNLIADGVEFAKKHKGCLIIIGDIKTDDLIACYDKHYSAATLKKKIFGPIAKARGVVKSIIERKGDVTTNIDKFNEYLDAFLWNLSNKIRENKVEEKLNKEDKKK